jgi:hypothetical protein
MFDSQRPFTIMPEKSPSEAANDIIDLISFAAEDIPISPQAFKTKSIDDTKEKLQLWAKENNFVFKHLTYPSFSRFVSSIPNRKDGNWESVICVVHLVGFGIKLAVTVTKGRDRAIGFVEILDKETE